METGIMYQKNLKITLADELLKQKEPFEKISQVTGWTINEIWLYVEMIYRKKYPRYYEEDIAYYSWGEKNVKAR